MGAKHLLPRFNKYQGSAPDIGSNILTVHGTGNTGVGANTIARWGTVYATVGDFSTKVTSPYFAPTSANFISYEGTENDHETTMTITDPTADRTIVFPDASGTVALNSISFDGSTSNGMCTYKDSDEISVESTLTYNGELLNHSLTPANGFNAFVSTYIPTTGWASGSNAGLGIVIILANYRNTASGETNSYTSLSLLTTDAATHVGTTSYIGLNNSIDFANTNGTQEVKGIKNTITDCDTAALYGIWQHVEDGGTDLYFESSDTTTNDYFSIATGASGATTITTVDVDVAGANLNFTIDGNITLSTPDEHYSTSIDRRKLTVTSSTDDDHNGDVVYFGGGSTTKGDICYLKTDGEWASAQANAENTSTQLLAIALGTDPDTDGMLLRGMYTLDHDVANNQGVPLYLSDGTAGQATVTVPDSNNDVVRVIGYNMGDDDQIWFCPDNTWVVVTA